MFGLGSFGSDVVESLDAAGNPRPKTWQDYSRVIEDGLPADERARLRESYLNLRYANRHFDDADAARSGTGDGGTVNAVRSDSDFGDLDSGDTRYDKPDFKLYPPVMARIVGKLSENLYKRSPTRELKDARVSDVVQEIYKQSKMDALWQEADRLTAIGGFAAFQFSGRDDPAEPIGVELWSADQLVPFMDDTNPRKVAAVATIDRQDGRTHVTLYTLEVVAHYVTRRGNHAGDETRKFELLKSEPNPYRDADGAGILPFAFVHFRFPSTEFSYDGPGTNLRELNRYLLHAFDEGADGVRYLVKPIGVAEGVAVDWEAPAVIRPGCFLRLTAGQVDAGGNGPQPRLSFLTPDSAWVGVLWSHLNNYLDLSLELENIPPSAVRMILDARSGVSILAEQAPLLGWTEQRRRQFLHYEADAVKVLLAVLAAHLRNNGRDAGVFDAAAGDPGLQILWPRLYIDLPGPERDRADGVRVTWGHASIIDLLMEREDCTRDQALKKLVRVRDDNAELQGLGIEPKPGDLAGKQAAPAFGAFPPPEGGNGLDAESMDATAAQGLPAPDGPPVDANMQADSLSQEGG